MPFNESNGVRVCVTGLGCRALAGTDGREVVVKRDLTLKFTFLSPRLDVFKVK